MSRPPPRARAKAPAAGAQDAPGLAARRSAALMLDNVLGRGRMFAENEGAGAERAEARRLADLTLRRLGQIDAVLEVFVSRPPPGMGHQILRLMVAELLFNATPPHAAVDVAVRLARGHRKTERLSGMINAVGRRVAEQGPEMVAEQDAAVLNTAPWLGGQLEEDWGTDVALAIVAQHMEVPAFDLTLRTPADAGLLATELGGRVLPTGTVRLDARPQVTALPGYATGAWWVQDAAAALPVQVLGDVAGKRVLDLCAAPGGKTLQLAARGAEVTALDISEDRLARLSDNLGRVGLSAKVVCADAFDWQPETPFDAILLDAPCSATGTVRRHPDLPHRTEGKFDALVRLQSGLLRRAAGWLAPGGTLVYCTCSLLKAEGEAQAARVASLGMGLVPDPIAPGEGLPPDFVTPEGTLRTRPDLWPDYGGLDGFFVARFRRAD